MPRALVIVLVAAVALGWLRAGRAAPADADSPGACDRAADAAERSHRLPQGILAAIGRVESGRPDAAGRLRPWPWTIDAAGAGAFLASAADAVAAVAALQEQGQRNIDVGCFQVNLQQHPDAFASLAAAFDPMTNADYAAGFLAALHERIGSWTGAVAAYHSANPDLGIPYRGLVLEQWAELTAAGGARIALADRRVGGSVVIAGVRIWSPGEPGTAPQVVRMEAEQTPSPPAASLTR